MNSSANLSFSDHIYAHQKGITNVFQSCKQLCLVQVSRQSTDQRCSEPEDLFRLELVEAWNYKHLNIR
jgi:hypothetical protein